ncbi:MAG: major tail protein [Clostridia bacterium]
MQNKKPMLKETVGALYLAFNTPNEKGEFDISTYEETIKSEVVKSISTTENAESTTVRASGQDYITVSQNSSVEQAVEVIAFDPETVAKMRADKIGKYLVKSGSTGERPYFAFGKVVKKTGNAVEYVWYPKCQLIENTDDISTSEESYSEQNDTLTIRAYSFDKDGNKSVRVNSEMNNFPEGLTEEMFFTKPLTTDEEIEALITPGT